MISKPTGADHDGEAAAASMAELASLANERRALHQENRAQHAAMIERGIYDKQEPTAVRLAMDSSLHARRRSRT